MTPLVPVVFEGQRRAPASRRPLSRATRATRAVEGAFVAPERLRPPLHARSSPTPTGHYRMEGLDRPDRAQSGDASGAPSGRDKGGYWPGAGTRVTFDPTQVEPRAWCPTSPSWRCARRRSSVRGTVVDQDGRTRWRAAPSGVSFDVQRSRPGRTAPFDVPPDARPPSTPTTGRGGSPTRAYPPTDWPDGEPGVGHPAGVRASTACGTATELRDRPYVVTRAPAVQLTGTVEGIGRGRGPPAQPVPGAPRWPCAAVPSPVIGPITDDRPAPTAWRSRSGPTPATQTHGSLTVSRRRARPWTALGGPPARPSPSTEGRVQTVDLVRLLPAGAEPVAGHRHRRCPRAEPRSPGSRVRQSTRPSGR